MDVSGELMVHSSPKLIGREILRTSFGFRPPLPSHLELIPKKCFLAFTLTIVIMASDMEFVKNFTPPDFQVRNFTPGFSLNLNSFIKKQAQNWSK